MSFRRWKGEHAFKKLYAWISTDNDDVDNSPSISAGSAAPSSTETNGSLYMRTNGSLYKYSSDAWALLTELTAYVPVKVTVDAAGGSGGATAGTLAVTVTDMNGVAITSAVQIALIVNASATRYAGNFGTPVSTVTFATATTGSIVMSGNGYAIIQTSATGTFACTISDSADETVYLSAQSLTGGVSSAGKGCTVVESNSDAATWAA